jgi:sortase B
MRIKGLDLHGIWQPLAFAISIAVACCVSVLVCECLITSENQGQNEVVEEDHTSVKEADDGSDDLRRLIQEQKRRQSSSFAEAPSRLASAKSFNPDVKAWLLVPGTNITLPIAESSHVRDYYLTHDQAGLSSPLGCIYCDSANDGDFRDPVTVLYGHSFSNESLMFTELHKFEELDYFLRHERVYIVDEAKVCEFRIVATCVYTDMPILDDGFFADNERVSSYIQFALNPSGSPTGFYGFQRTDIKKYDENTRILQLSTCTLPACEGARYVLTAIFENEYPVDGFDFSGTSA